MGKIDNNGFDHLKTGQRVDKEKDEYIPVNKGHFEMDSDERIMAFHQILGKGWESKYKEYREAWQVLPSNKIIRDYPVIEIWNFLQLATLNVLCVTPLLTSLRIR